MTFRVRMSDRQAAARVKWCEWHLANETDFTLWVFSDEKWFFQVMHPLMSECHECCAVV